MLTVALLALPRHAEGAANGVQVTIQAQPRFETESPRARGAGIEIEARLIDDTGAPLGGARVRVDITETAAPPPFEPCSAEARPSRRADTLVTGADGRLCVRVLDAKPSGVLALSYDGDGLHLAARAELALHAARSELALSFRAPSLELDLDQPLHRLELKYAGAAPDTHLSLELALHEPSHQTTLAGSEWLQTKDTLAFTLRSEDLGAPGPARLIARFPGSAEHLPTQAEAVALRVARVTLEGAVLGLDESGVDVEVTAHTRAGPPTSGSIQASIAGAPVATTSLVDGQGRLHLPRLTPLPRAVLLTYRADDAWWLPGAPLELELSGARAGSATARWPWLVMLMPIAYVCSRALQRPAPRKPPRRPRPHAPRPALASREPPTEPISGWLGTVRDAHEGTPVVGARVEAVLPSMRAAASAVRALTDAAGRFALPALPEPVGEGARLKVWAPLHTEVDRPLPPHGRVDIALISRRRSLLRRLVRWARSMGPPWHQATEPTPKEIVDVALRRGELATARWAEAVEVAAFGSTDVDEAHEAALRAREPAWQKPREASSRDHET